MKYAVLLQLKTLGQHHLALTQTEMVSLYFFL